MLCAISSSWSESCRWLTARTRGWQSPVSPRLLGHFCKETSRFSARPYPHALGHRRRVTKPMRCQQLIEHVAPVVPLPYPWPAPPRWQGVSVRVRTGSPAATLQLQLDVSALRQPPRASTLDPSADFHHGREQPTVPVHRVPPAAWSGAAAHCKTIDSICWAACASRTAQRGRLRTRRAVSGLLSPTGFVSMSARAHLVQAGAQVPVNDAAAAHIALLPERQGLNELINRASGRGVTRPGVESSEKSTH
jgi:hypothetical protein